jgi:hypothetical protein
MLQQHDDAKFGFFEHVIPTDKVADYVKSLSLFLPITVSSMWTLAESIDSNFKLFRSV